MTLLTRNTGWGMSGTGACPRADHRVRRRISSAAATGQWVAGRENPAVAFGAAPGPSAAARVRLAWTCASRAVERWIRRPQEAGERFRAEAVRWPTGARLPCSPLSFLPLSCSIRREAANRGDWIRTSDFLLPKQARYRTALRPVGPSLPAARAWTDHVIQPEPQNVCALYPPLRWRERRTSPAAVRTRDPAGEPLHRPRRRIS